jgi:D-alanine-D-alanine ligase
MNITILSYVTAEGSSEFDGVVSQVAGALRTRGHKVSLLGAHADVGRLLAGLRRRKPELVFNLTESFGDDLVLGGVSVAGLLSLLGVPYTGGGPGELFLQTDKGLAKKLLAFEKIPCPDFAVFGQSTDLETGGHLRLPLFVKPLRMEASIGIDARSLVHTPQEMMERIGHIHAKVHDSALVEEYIEGREFYIGILGNAEPEAFPPVEMDFSGLPNGKAHVVDARAKWSKNSVEYRGTRAVLAELPDDLTARLQKVALCAYRALRVRDYGRVDLRLTPDGEVYVIEVNASCYLEKTGEFATAAAAAGCDYPQLIGRIVDLAIQRARQDG